MSNMSYCRFENTLADLQDCYENMDEETNKQDEKAKVALIKLCVRIAGEYADETKPESGDVFNPRDVAILGGDPSL